MDITNSVNPEPSHEPGEGVPPVEAALVAKVEPTIEGQETPNAPDNTESTAGDKLLTFHVVNIRGGRKRGSV